ncbi:venom acid phosphatase Acph-1-like [Prorops nasuta]|uniref:venom acid phosphatase Acph-1-like n=1 Tax=Prorops nasuta TaxID=863751 RepID=UPI0034CE83CA
MVLYRLLHLAVLSIFITPILSFALRNDDSNVIFLNVLFRHGDRYPKNTAGDSEWYPNDPHINNTFSPFGPGQLTLNGKMREYNIGKKLRELYNKFLGVTYTPNLVAARSTNSDRTKMSLQLLLAALYPPPPNQKWHPALDWQPIPYSSVPKPEDGLLQPAEACPLFKEEYEANLQSSEVQEKVAAFETDMEMLQNYTGRNITTVKDAFHLYHGLIAITRLGLPLPEWATRTQLYPESMARMANLQYSLESYNTKLKRRNGGMLLRRMIDDMNRIVAGDKSMKGRKLNLYSAHESNINAFLQTLGILESPHVPEYSSGVFVELSQEEGEYFVRVFYYLGIPAIVKPMTIPECASKCPLKHFIKLLKKVTPADEELKCDKTRSSL